MNDEYEITVDELDAEACWRLLSRARFGRVGFVADDAITMLPVNAAVSHRRIVFRTADDTSLAAIRSGSVVAFECDHTDNVAESGWSVLVRGRIHDASGSPETRSWEELDVHPWAPRPRNRWMLIQPATVTGRMIHRHRIATEGTHVPYMSPD